ncbi:MAG: hypothetical protein Q9227_004621 [Pyrenula ochraceoflavens]
MLIEGRSGHGQMPISKFNAEAFYHPNPDRPGSIHSTGGYFINEDTRLFDNKFFGINNVEATYMDPQQRKLLETVYESFESAGVCLENVSGADVGCFVANFTNDFQTMQNKDLEYCHRYTSTGLGSTIMANRISHVFNLRGPSFALDTASAANLIQSPEMYLGAVKAGILSGTSTCHTFDSSADGYGRAEGVSSLFLKRLGDAIRDNDPIRSVIRGTAVNSNGKTSGITAPSADGQEAVIRKAYANANLRPDETDYIEVGDSVEVDAIARVLKRKDSNPLLVGSVKTNLGHSEAASGISSIIKVAMSLESGLIPPTIGVINVNPSLRLAERDLEIVTETTSWPTWSTVRRASVNGFGYGGANAHVILEAYNAFTQHINTHPSAMISHPHFLLLPLSASHDFSLRSRLDGLPDLNPYDLAYTLIHRRSKFSHRGFAITKSLADRKEALRLEIETFGDAITRVQPLAFVFSGQGAQWPCMGQELIQQYPTYRRAIMDMDIVLSSLQIAPTWSLLDIIMQPRKASQLHLASHSQPASTATQIALVILFREWGIEPMAVIGHSSGEIAAAFAAGHITASEAIQIAYLRGHVSKGGLANGAMLAVALEKTRAMQHISDLGLLDSLCIACENAPESVTVSGDADAVDKLLLKLQEQGVFVRRLNTGGMAYHSHHMKSLGRHYEDLLGQVFPHHTTDPVENIEPPNQIQMVSTVTAEPIGREITRSPLYWRQNLESPVLFDTACRKMLQTQSLQILEMGPHSTMKMPVQEIKRQIGLADKDAPYFPTLLRGQNSVLSLLKTAGALYIQGHDVKFESINNTALFASILNRLPRVLYNLPNYAWSYDKPLWAESRLSTEYRLRQYARHDLLGSRLPANSGETACWRNILKLNDVPWLADHRLDEVVVFPAAGYISIACEAMCQCIDLDAIVDQRLQLRSVKIRKLLAFPNVTTGIEIFTELRRMKNSGVSSSSTWKEFNISSYIDGVSTTHASGVIGFDSQSRNPIARKQPIRSLNGYQKAEIWYERFHSEGMNFGPAFQSMLGIWTDPQKNLMSCSSASEMKSIESSALKNSSKSAMHPICLDAMLQSALIATAAGSTKNLSSKVPVSITSVQISFLDRASAGSSCTIRANSRIAGLKNAIIDAEMEDADGNILLQLNEVKVAAYQRKSTDNKITKPRDPIFRIIWKPNISAVLSRGWTSGIAHYMKSFVARNSAGLESEGVAHAAGYLDILAHANPRIRVLHLTGEDEWSNDHKFLDLAVPSSKIRRYARYVRGCVIGDEVCGRDIVSAADSRLKMPLRALDSNSVFDVVLDFQGMTRKMLAIVSKHMAPSYIILKDSTELPRWRSSQDDTAVATCESECNGAVLPKKDINSASHIDPELQIVVVNEHPTKSSILSDGLEEIPNSLLGQPVSFVPLSEASSSSIPPKSIVIATVELEEPLLQGLDVDKLRNLKALTENASIILWISAGNLFRAERPDFSIVQGLARALVLEQPSLKFLLLSISESEVRSPETLYNINFILRQALGSSDTDTEYIQNGGVLYSSRFIPAESLNKEFQAKQGTAVMPMTLEDAGRVDLHVKETGHLDSIYFQQNDSRPAGLGKDDVEVKVMSIGLNAKDLYVLNGTIDTENGTNCLEFSGTVVAVGCEVSGLVIGDRVTAMAPCRFATFERVPAWACCKLEDNEDFHTVSVLGISFSTALYALKHRAQIQKGQSLLIHSAAGGVGIAVIQIARLMGAEVFGTVGTDEKREFLTKEFGIPSDHLFSSRDTSFVDGILGATSGRGVDVVVNSLTGDLLHEGRRVCADFGCFIEIGKRDILDGGKLNMDFFERNVTFTAFDLSNLYYSKIEKQNQVWSELLQETMSLFRRGEIRPFQPLQIFDVSETANAFKRFANGTRIGKIAISLSNRDSAIPVVPSTYRTIFDPNKLYLMVGCLGGLGRSLSKWMCSQGARKFLFLGRSGLEKPVAKSLADDLEASGSVVHVVRGDVSLLADVHKLITEANEPIYGVVHAAMALHEALFSSMTVDQWNSALAPKVQGTWNLHNALLAQNAPLDFFLLTSSISGSVGTATESNYCAANAFQDTFARYRHSLGLPAISIGLGMISEVGYLHEHPEIEALLLRKGLRPINEKEMLQIVDIALSHTQSTKQPPALATTMEDKACEMIDHFASAHILTGLESFGLQDQRDRGFEGNSHFLDDPRASILVHAFEGSSSTAAQTNADTVDPSSRVPAPVAAALSNVRASSDPSSEALATLSAAIQDTVILKLRNLLLLEEGTLTAETKLGRFGMDSMLAAEFRMFVFHSFQVDVPFALLLAANTCVSMLVDVVVAELVKEK